MCTAITFHGNDHYFGRNLDLEYHYNEEVTIMPRCFPLHFRCLESKRNHYAIIGMATIAYGYPLYYDATNEWGLSVAGLNFPENAHYCDTKQNFDNIAPFEFIPWILSQCKNIEETLQLLTHTNLIDMKFSSAYPVSSLHWIISDKQSSISVEPRKNGLSIQDNPIGVLTNNPPFEYHMNNLSQYLNLTSAIPNNMFAGQLIVEPTSRGLGAVGLPGDLSSASRFVRASFSKLNAIAPEDEDSCVGQFFHILDSVSQIEGCCKAEKGYVKTVYSSCCNTDRGIYYYTTYNNRQINAVHMHQSVLDGPNLQSFPLIHQEQIRHIN